MPRVVFEPTIPVLELPKTYCADMLAALRTRGARDANEFAECRMRQVTAESGPVLRLTRGVFMPRQTRQLPRAVDLKGRLLSCQSY